jgi:hypothetical protein
MAAAAALVTAAAIAADATNVVAAIVIDIFALTAAIAAAVALASLAATAIAFTDVVANAAALTQQEAEEPVDGRCWRHKRQHDNQPDERDNRGATRGGIATRGGEVTVNGRRWCDERQRDNQPDERHEMGHWQRKQQQLQLCNNQQKRNGAKTRSSSHQEVLAQWLTWQHQLHNCRGGSNDDYNVATTTTTTKVLASVGSINVRQTQLTPTLMSTSASCDFCIRMSQ